MFEDTLPHTEVGQIALLHIDGDWYRSVLTCLEQLYDHVAPPTDVPPPDGPLFGLTEVMVAAEAEYVN